MLRILLQNVESKKKLPAAATATAASPAGGDRKPRREWVDKPTRKVDPKKTAADGAKKAVVAKKEVAAGTAEAAAPAVPAASAAPAGAEKPTA